MKNGEGSTSKQRVVYEYDFFDENRTDPVRTHLVPMGREATPADLEPVEPWFIPTEVNEADILFEKTLEATDVSSNTLSVGGSEVVMWALTDEERRNIERGEILEVETTDPSGNGYMMQLKRSRIFIGVAEMSGEWSKLVSVNKLKEGDWVCGWGYRKDGRLCIAIKYHHRLT